MFACIIDTRLDAGPPEFSACADSIPIVSWFWADVDYPPRPQAAVAEAPRAEALRRASLERKLAGKTSNSQQHIVEHCVSTWLRANGYLNARD